MKSEIYKYINNIKLRLRIFEPKDRALFLSLPNKTSSSENPHQWMFTS